MSTPNWLDAFSSPGCPSKTVWKKVLNKALSIKRVELLRSQNPAFFSVKPTEEILPAIFKLTPSAQKMILWARHNPVPTTPCTHCNNGFALSSPFHYLTECTHSEVMISRIQLGLQLQTCFDNVPISSLNKVDLHDIFVGKPTANLTDVQHTKILADVATYLIRFTPVGEINLF